MTRPESFGDNIRAEVLNDLGRLIIYLPVKSGLTGGNSNCALGAAAGGWPGGSEALAVEVDRAVLELGYSKKRAAGWPPVRCYD